MNPGSMSAPHDRPVQEEAPVRQVARRGIVVAVASALMAGSALAGTTGIALADTDPTTPPVVIEPTPEPTPDPTPEPTPAPSDPADPTDPSPDPAPEPEPDPEPEPEPDPEPAPAPAKPETGKVTFLLDRDKLTGFTKVPAGSVIRIKGVNPKSTIEAYNAKDPEQTFVVHQTRKSRLFKTAPLPPSTRIWIKVQGSDGTTAKVSLKTQAAPNTFSVSVSPREGTGKYGAGIPVRVTFGVPIKNKAAVEAALVIETNTDIGKAGWYWESDRMAVFRPKKYWPANTKVTLTADLRTVEGADGWWGPKVENVFRIGDQVIMETNFRTHTMTFIRNGEVERTFPISGGMTNWETKSGVKLVTTHEKQRRLINPDPEEGWDVLTNYAMRISQDGEFIHDAPWNYYIGRYNTSHGCTNMYLSDAEWVFKNTRFGDIVESKGTSVKVSTKEYLAGYWNVSWADWKAGSAL